MNPMLQALGQIAKPQANNANAMAGNPMTLLQQFADFKKQMSGKNPEAMVQELLQSGKMSQAQFEDLKKQADAFQSLLK